MNGICYTFQDINYPVNSDNKEIFVLEYNHNGVLNWLGGSAADAATVAYDPVFYFISACTDFIWEVFRKNQQNNCEVDPSFDYPTNINDLRTGPYETMSGFSDLSNIRGYSNEWTNLWYTYTLAQSCPNCNSEFFWCDPYKNRCISHSRRTDHNVLATVHLASGPFEPVVEYIPHRVELAILPSPLNDGRTMASSKLDAKTYVTDRQRSLNTQRRNMFVLSALGQSSLLPDSLSNND